MPKSHYKARKDNRGRTLNRGESQRSSDGMYIYTYNNVMGGRCYVYSKNLQKLREKVDKLRLDMSDGIDAYLAGKVTLNDVYSRYMSTKYHLRETTRVNYMYMYDNFVRDTLGQVLIAKIRYSDIKSFYQKLLKDRGLKINTLDNIHSVLHPTFQMAVRDDIIRKNPTDGVMAELKKSEGKNKGIRHALTLEQQRAFMSYVEKSPTYYHWLPLFTFLLGTGCRIGEAIGITWKNIDFKNHKIVIDHAVVYYKSTDGRMFHVSKPKTEKGIREIPMHAQVQEILELEYKRQRYEGFSTVELDGLSGFVFTNRLGALQNPHCVNSAIERITEDYNAKEVIVAGREHREPVIIPHFSCHHFRHTFCSRLCECESNVKIIQEIMGHADVETTLDIYAEVNYNKKQESMDNLSAKMDIF